MSDAPQITFVKYPKIHRLGKDETIGILDGEVIIQEKIDGANTSIWMDKDGVIRTGSRTRELPAEETFNGFNEYVKDNKAIQRVFAINPEFILYGEWLVRHTLQYNELNYKKWYMFDIVDRRKIKVTEGGYDLTEAYLDPEQTQDIAEKCGVPYPQTFTKGKLTEEQVREFVGKSFLGDKGEGVVIKRSDYVNQFGSHAYAKVVTQEFTEGNALVFGGNNKHSETYWEMYIVNKYATLPRVKKIMDKLQPVIDKTLDLEHTPRVAGSAYHDLLTEEIWEISKKVGQVDFRKLKGLATRKFVQIYKDIILGTPSIADQDNAK